MRSVAVTPRQGKYLYCVHFFFNCCKHFCIILQKYSATKGGRCVVMATTSTAPAAKFLNVSLRKCSSGKNCTEGRDSARWSWPLSSQRPERVPQTRWRADRLREARLQPENKPTLCPSVFLVHLRPFHSGPHPIRLETEEEGTRRQRTRQGRGCSEWEDQKCAKVTQEREKKGMERMWWFLGSQKNVTDVSRH